MMRGYIYALINPSLPDQVKIGCTDRIPASRAAELSNPMGMPSPFVVACQRAVSNCEEGEKWVRAVLERHGYRVSDRRELFDAPLHEIVDAIYSYPDQGNDACVAQGREEKGAGVWGMAAELTGDAFLDRLTVENDPVWADVFEQARAYDLGDEDHPQEAREAFKLYKQAGQLGCGPAFRRLGCMCRDGDIGSKDDEQALAYFKKAIVLGDFVAYAEMAHLFEPKHTENELKCYERFVASLAEFVEAGHFSRSFSNERQIMEFNSAVQCDSSKVKEYLYEYIDRILCLEGPGGAYRLYRRMPTSLQPAARDEIESLRQINEELGDEEYGEWASWLCRKIDDPEYAEPPPIGIDPADDPE